jgi:hypothetical protein
MCVVISGLPVIRPGSMPSAEIASYQQTSQVNAPVDVD